MLEPKGFGRIRLRRISDDSERQVIPFVKDVIQAGATVHTDGSAACRSLKDEGYVHQKSVMLGSDTPAHVSMPGVRRVAALIHRWLLGTHQGAVQPAKLDYFVKDAFRNELRRVLNRGEAVNALKRAIYTGRVSPAQAKCAEEMQAVADALSLLANIIMAWNTTQMQAVLDRWANRRQVIPAELTGKIAPTRLQGINLRSLFRFPVERYASEILPSQTTPKTGTGG